MASLSVKNKREEKKFGKEIGEYIIVNSPLLNFENDNCLIYTQKILNKVLKTLVQKPQDKILIVGLGNQAIQADSLGGKVIENIIIKDNIYLLKPDVYGNTNIMSFDIINGVCKTLKPSLVVLIDSLAIYNIKRLASSFQFCNVGILPGGALHGMNKTISVKTLGIPCVVVGVPFMIFASGLCPSLKQPYDSFILSLKDIDEIVSRCGKMIADAIMQVYWFALNAVG